MTGKTYIPHTRARVHAHDGFTSEASLSVTPVTALRTIARDVSRLRPDWRDPERYFEHREEIVRDLRRLARTLEQSRV